MTREELIRITLQNKIRVMEVKQRVEISSEIDPKFITMINEDLYKHKSCRYIMTIWHVDENLRGNYQAIACKTSTNRFGNYKNYKGNYKLVGIAPIEEEVQVFKDNIILFEQTMFRGINIERILV